MKFRFPIARVGPFDTLEIGLGIDPQQNHEITTPGDLDPNSQMAWNWLTGYKFLLLEGTYFPTDGSTSIPLVYHIGFSENYQTVRFSLADPIFDNATSSTRLAFTVQIDQLFQTPHEIDMAYLPSIKFEKESAAKMAENFGNLLRLESTP